MKSNLINYNLFYSRNNFSPVLFIKNNNIDSYEKFCNLLEERGVNTPGLEYYNRVVNHIKSESKEEEIVIEKNKTEVTVEEEIEAVTPDPSPKKVRRRRSRKKT